jgi:hypothetical protein
VTGATSRDSSRVSVSVNKKGEMVRIHGRADEARLARVLDPLMKPTPTRPRPASSSRSTSVHRRARTADEGTTRGPGIPGGRRHTSARDTEADAVH